MKVLVTGGLGYIGSHTCVELLNQNHEVVVIDNLYNSQIEVKDKIEEITGKEIKVYIGDMIDKKKIDEIFEENDIDAVIHFAGYKAVGESVQKPLEYYENNIGITLNLLFSMREHDVKTFVFSSSATVYDSSNESPLKEGMRVGATNPYGQTKVMIEQILRDVYVSDDSWNIVLLRYFNPIGSHKSGLIGENPKGIPNNLMPYIAQVASGKLEKLHVFGDDYNTPDGTGVRDYIHVVDLAKGHILALNKTEGKAGVFTYNLGTGKGVSVLDLLGAFEEVNNIKIPYVIDERRPGDLATVYADPTKAEKELGFKTEKTVEDMVRDTWNFQQKLEN